MNKDYIPRPEKYKDADWQVKQQFKLQVPPKSFSPLNPAIESQKYAQEMQYRSEQKQKNYMKAYEPQGSRQS